jgi:hypothetical protein
MNSEPHPFDNAPLCHPSAQCTLNLDGTLSLIFNISSAFETNLLLRVPSLSVRSRVIVKVVLAAKQAVALWSLTDLLHLRPSSGELAAAVGTLVLGAADKSRHPCPDEPGIADDEVRVNAPVDISVEEFQDRARTYMLMIMGAVV